MSWNSIYPVMSDEMVEAYEQQATSAEKARMEEWFGVERILNPSPSDHIVSVSLFWKNVDLDQPDLPPASEELMRHAGAAGLVTRYAPWKHYVEPLLRGAARLKAELPEAVLRVYLAKDMEWLAERLVDLKCEVYVMKSSSLRHTPGSLWRFLAMEDADHVVSFLDADNVDSRLDLVHRAELLKKSDLPTWRKPNANVAEVDAGGSFVYRPMIAWPLATTQRLPMRQLMEAFVWQSLRGGFPSVISYPGKGNLPYFGSTWPGYGFDEWFLSVAIYPRLATAGMITEVSTVQSGYSLALDVEYATWANSLHETYTPLKKVEVSAEKQRMLQFGTSGNVIKGWENFDYPEVDITVRLPFPDGCAKFIFLEHVIEHVTARDAWNFFEDCRRVLEPGGVLRLAFPDVVKIFQSAAPCYDEFIAKQGWGDGTREPSVKVILFEHGHQAAWTAEAMIAILSAQGYRAERQEIGQSAWEELRNVEQHCCAVGHEVNASETVVVEAINLNPRLSLRGPADWALP